MSGGKLKIKVTSAIALAVAVTLFGPDAFAAERCENIDQIVCAAGQMLNPDTCECSPPPCPEVAFHCLPGERVDTAQCRCVREDSKCVKYTNAIVIADDGSFSVKKLCLGELPPADAELPSKGNSGTCEKYAVGANSAEEDSVLLQTLINHVVCDEAKPSKPAKKIARLKAQLAKLKGKK